MTQQLAPEAQRRLKNQARMWEAKYAACTSYAEAVRVAFDRARAAARAAERGGNAEAWDDLTQLLNRWCVAMEKTQAQRAGR